MIVVSVFCAQCRHVIQINDDSDDDDDDDDDVSLRIQVYLVNSKTVSMHAGSNRNSQYS